MSTIAVIGAGIAGLAAAHRLGAEHDVIVFERDERPGGKIRSQHLDGFVFEWGPGGFLSSADDVLELIAAAGLEGELTQAGPAAKNRYIFWAGKLHKVPAKPPEMLRMTLLSTAGKVRAAGDLFVRRRADAAAAGDESVFAFIERRFGREVAERIVAPVVLGVSGGDAKNTSLAAIFPRLPAIERENGSVIRGMIRGARTAARMCSFAGAGMQRLTDRLAERLGSRLQLGSRVERIEPAGDRWCVVHDGTATLVDGVIVTTPSDAAAELVANFAGELAAQLRSITYAPMRAVGVAFRAADVAAPLEAFGFLAARGSGVRILGAVYTSTIVPEQAPPGTVYLRVFLGGAADAAAVALDQAQARAIVLADLATALGITAEPVAYHEAVWPKAIPQYGLGHRNTVASIEALTAQHRGLAFAGNAYRGLGVADTVKDATAVAATFCTSAGR